MIKHTLPEPPGLIHCDTVLDLGAGIRPMQWYVPQVHTCVDPYEPYCRALRQTERLTVIHATAREALDAGARAEAVYLLDVIEHMEKADGLELIPLLQAAASRQVVIYTPMGFKPQSRDNWGFGGHSWQTHRSGWLPREFEGWRIFTFIPHQGAAPEGFYAMWTR